MFLCYLKLFNSCTTAFEIKSNLLKMALSFIRISLNTMNITYALLRWTTCCFSNLLCTFFTLYLGIIYSFYTLNFNFFSSRYLAYPPLARPRSQSIRFPIKNFTTSLWMKWTFHGPLTRRCPTFSEFQGILCTVFQGPFLLLRKLTSDSK